MYGTGMRVSEAIVLRIQDIDFGQNEIIIKKGKGGIILMKVSCSVQFSTLSVKPESPSVEAAIHFAIPLQHIFLKTATTSVQFRNFSAILT